MGGRGEGSQAEADTCGHWGEGVKQKWTSTFGSNFNKHLISRNGKNHYAFSRKYKCTVYTVIDGLPTFLPTAFLTKRSE